MLLQRVDLVSSSREAPAVYTETCSSRTDLGQARQMARPVSRFFSDINDLFVSLAGAVWNRPLCVSDQHFLIFVPRELQTYRHLLRIASE